MLVIISYGVLQGYKRVVYGRMFPYQSHEKIHIYIYMYVCMYRETHSAI